MISTTALAQEAPPAALPSPTQTTPVIIPPPQQAPPPAVTLADQLRADWQGAAALLTRFVQGHNEMVAQLQKQIDDLEAQKATVMGWLQQAQQKR